MQHLTVKAAPARSENGVPSYTFYVINADGFTISTGSSPIESIKTQLIVDTGSPLTYLPADVAKAVNDAWSPAARLDPFTRQYLVNCQSTPPKFGVKLNATTVWFDAKGLAVPAVSGGSGTLCVSGIQAVRGGAKGAGGLSILGGTFLKGVVAVFDVGAAEMRFANRVR
jgi:aspergillopepsin I